MHNVRLCCCLPCVHTWYEFLFLSQPFAQVSVHPCSLHAMSIPSSLEALAWAALASQQASTLWLNYSQAANQVPPVAAATAPAQPGAFAGQHGPFVLVVVVFCLDTSIAWRSHGTKHILVCRRIASRRYQWPRNRSRDVAFLAPQVHRTLGGSPFSSSWKAVVGSCRRGRPHALSALQSTAMLLICSLLCTCHLAFLQNVVGQDHDISNASGHNLETMDGSCRHGLFPSLTTTHPAVSCFEWLCDHGDDYAPALIAAVGNLLCTSSHQGYGFAFPFVCRNCGVRVCLCNCISEIMNGGSSLVVSSTQFAPHIAVSCVCWCDEGADFASHLVAPLGSWNDYLNYQGYGFAFPLVSRVCGVRAHFGSTWGGYRHEGGTVKARKTRFGVKVFPHQWTCQAPSSVNSTAKVLLSYPAGGAQAGNRRQVLIGEAACPGPGPLILSVNVSSLEAGWPDVADLAWDVALIQEARVSPDSLVLGDIRRAHCQIFLCS